MLRCQVRRVSGITLFLLFCFVVLPGLQAQPSHYEPTLESALPGHYAYVLKLAGPMS